MSEANPANQPIEPRILFLRSHRVILDTDLAGLYGVTIKRLREQVRRNPDRFPDEFMFTLNFREKDEVAAKCGDLGNLRFSRTLPFVFTEFGALMAANILNSPTAIKVSVEVIRAFVRMREVLAAHRELADKLAAMEEKYDVQFLEVFEAIEMLAEVGDQKRNRKLGFVKD
jgi:hypothetical protein